MSYTEEIERIPCVISNNNSYDNELLKHYQETIVDQIEIFNEELTDISTRLDVLANEDKETPVEYTKVIEDKSYRIWI